MHLILSYCRYACEGRSVPKMHHACVAINLERGPREQNKSEAADGNARSLTLLVRSLPRDAGSPAGGMKKMRIKH